LLKLILACICLFFLAALAAFAFAFFFTDWIQGDDNANSRSGDGIAPTNPPTMAPTTGSTAGPTPDPLPLTLFQAFNGPETYGTSVALDADWMAVGAPNSPKGGVVSTHTRRENGSWKFVPEIENQVTSFGAALDMFQENSNVAYLLVGAPTHNTHGTATLYKYAGATTNSWVVQGNLLEGIKDVAATAEEFGSAVALSHNLRAVVGAPRHDTQGNDAGRIYTFQYTPASNNNNALTYDAQPLAVNEPLLGTSAGSRFGTDVDITPDGLWVVAGEPGRNSFSIFSWKEESSLWLKDFEDTIADEGDFGSSVHFLSDNYVAVGSPLAEGGRGRIRVYERTDTDENPWTLMKPLTGASMGDALGQTQTISGREGPNGPELVLGTAKGAVVRYDWLPDNNRWVQRYNVDRDSSITAIASHHSNTDYEVLAGYSNAQQSLLFSGTPPPESTPPPTDAPTSSVPKTWQEIAGPLTRSAADVNNKDTKYGHAVALVDEFLTVGEPHYGDDKDIGNIAIYDRSGSVRNAEFGFVTDTLQFGYSLSARMVNNKPAMIVGAVDTKDVNEFARFGSAHVYERGDNGWEAVGDMIQPTILPPEAAGAFGASVAMASEKRRIVVGAPSSSVDLENIDTGRVYTFEFNGNAWEWMSAPLVGTKPGGLLGTSVDMSKDGSRMLIGSPGSRSGDGTAYYYQFNGTEWKSILPMRGTDGSGEGFGTTVSIISDDGKTIAFGGPDYGDNQGTVTVYRESDAYPGLFLPVGATIVGAVGERIGTTLAGAQNRVAVGTDAGSFHVYQESGNSWVEVSPGPTNLGSKVVSIDLSEDASTVAVGLENQEVLVYELM